MTLRLNQKAFNILMEEVDRCASNSEVGKTEKKIVVKLLRRFSLKKNERLAFDELREVVADIYPQFSEAVIKQAIAANRSLGIVGIFKFFVLLLASAGGFLWILNLPKPMIRFAVVKTAPILLIPSFWSMDYSYREAINTLEQAEQLLNNPKSTADIQLGQEKLKVAKKHLDKLPVWFLGYYPHTYCNWFDCSWKFSLDEFKTARERVTRLQAIAFENQNALSPSSKAEQALLQAEQEYKQAIDIEGKQKAIGAWKNAISLFDEIPAETLVGRNAKAKIKGYKQEFDDALILTNISAAHDFDLQAQKNQLTNPQFAYQLWQRGINILNTIPNENSHYSEAQKILASLQAKAQIADEYSSIHYIEAAKKYALSAATITQEPPHQLAIWQQSKELWSNAIWQLQQVNFKDVDYVEAQKMIAQYQTNLGIVRARYEAEKNGEEVIFRANQKIQDMIAYSPSNIQQRQSEIQRVIDMLETVNTGTTSYPKARKLLIMAQRKMQSL